MYPRHCGVSSRCCGCLLKGVREITVIRLLEMSHPCSSGDPDLLFTAQNLNLKVALLVKCLSSMQGAMCLNPTTQSRSLDHIPHPNTREVGAARRSGVQSHLQLLSKFEVSLGSAVSKQNISESLNEL